MQLVHVKFVVLIFIIIITKNGFSQTIDWEKASHWKFYDTRGKKPLRYSVDSLYHFNTIDLNDDTLRYFLHAVELWPPEEYSMWMGGFAVSYVDEKGILRKLDISDYGGFFFDEFSKRYYQIREDIRNYWLKYFHNLNSQFQNQ